MTSCSGGEAKHREHTVTLCGRSIDRHTHTQTSGCHGWGRLSAEDENNRLAMVFPLEWHVFMSQLFKNAYIKRMQLLHVSYSLKKVAAANCITL